MKTLRSIIIIIAAIAIVSSSSCSVFKSNEEQNRADSIAYVVAKAITEEQHFLIPVNHVMIMNTNIPSVSTTTNFILVDGTDGVVQLSPGYGGGPNGVGGFTVKGTVRDYKTTPLKNGDIQLQFHVSAPIGSCDVNATIVRNTGNVIANVQSAFRKGRTTMYGEIRPIDNSYYLGRTPF